MNKLNKMTLGRWYKPSSNGKMELWGVDGANHGVYAALITLIVMGIGLISLPLFWVKVAMTITSITIVLFFFGLEVGQEYKRLESHGTYGNPLLWWRTENAQIEDFCFPSLATIIITALFIIMVH